MVVKSGRSRARTDDRSASAGGSTGTGAQKTVPIKLHDDATGATKVIDVPAPPEEDDDELETEMDAALIARVARGCRVRRLDGQSVAHIEQTFPEFARQYPVLFAKSCDPSFSMELLEYMLEEMQRVKQGEFRNMNTVTDRVVERLNSRYVNHVVDKLEAQRHAGAEGGGTANGHGGPASRQALRRAARDAEKKERKQR